MEQAPFLSLVRALRALRLDGHESPEGPLSASEAAWLSGYFAALALDKAQRDELARLLFAPNKAPAPAGSHPIVRVLYGTETGNAAGVAKKLAERLSSIGLAVEVQNLADYAAKMLEREHTVVIVTSTHGDGTPPEPAARFFDELSGPRAPKNLGKLRFAVLGLGDSSYEHFCRAAKVVDAKLAELGAQRLLARVDCDVDYAEDAESFTKNLVELLRPEAERASPSVEVSGRGLHGVVSPEPARPSYDKAHPFLAAVIENERLTGRGSSKDVRHLALDLEGSSLTFTPGDALGVCAPNHPGVVDDLLRALALSGDEQTSLGSEHLPLRDALTGRLDVTVPSPRFLEAWADISNADALRALLAKDHEEERKRFLRMHHVLDIVRAYPAAHAIHATTFASLLRPLAPRLYSIASSQAAVPTEVHLTVSVVRYEQNGRLCTGVASGHIAERATCGATLPVYVHENPSFRLPDDPNAPIVMIGAGTGIAPYRAFLQERAARGAKGRSWLFFGERNFRTDFLYQVEWQAWLRDKTLSKMSVAFSRDQGEKTYVQDRLLEHAREVYAWLEEGAYVYVCGDAQGMAPSVHEALLTVIERERGSRELAQDYLYALREQRRYQRDVY